MQAEAESGVKSFTHAGFALSFIDPVADAAREPVLLIHGFASSFSVNWVAPGWVALLIERGYRPIAFDNRGHGGSAKSYDPRDYTPAAMAADAAALLDRLAVPRAHVMGYSMGARIAAFMALAYPEKVATVVFGGLGIGMVEGVGEWDPIARALAATDAADAEPGRPRMFRDFADRTGSDRAALAACIAAARELLSRDDVARISQPALIGVGTRDDLAGSAEELAAAMPDATAFAIASRDHMLAVGDRSWKARVLDFLEAHRL
jgi:pimeloyl-ACP methyl ester carboxylesterase